MRRHLLLLAPAFLWTVAAVGCGQGRDGSEQPASTVAVAFCCAAEALNPSMELRAKFLLFLPLLTEDESGNPLGAHRGLRAEVCVTLVGHRRIVTLRSWCAYSRVRIRQILQEQSLTH
jgi:hypothetical protein